MPSERMREYTTDMDLVPASSRGSVDLVELNRRLLEEISGTQIKMIEVLRENFRLKSEIDQLRKVVSVQYRGYSFPGVSPVPIISGGIPAFSTRRIPARRCIDYDSHPLEIRTLFEDAQDLQKTVDEMKDLVDSLEKKSQVNERSEAIPPSGPKPPPLANIPQPNTTKVLPAIPIADTALEELFASGSHSQSSLSPDSVVGLLVEADVPEEFPSVKEEPSDESELAIAKQQRKGSRFDTAPKRWSVSSSKSASVALPPRASTLNLSLLKPEAPLEASRLLKKASTMVKIIPDESNVKP